MDGQFPDETFDENRPRYSHRRMMQEIARAKAEVSPTLRDYFAAHALMSLNWGSEASASAKAEHAYKTADAMLFVRSQKPA